MGARTRAWRRSARGGWCSVVIDFPGHLMETIHCIWWQLSQLVHPSPPWLAMPRAA